MLQVPKSVVARWSPFATQWIEVERLLQARLDGVPAVEGCGLSLERVDALGWRSRRARLLYDEACERVAQRCVDAGRYAHNIGVWQALNDLDDAHLALATNTDRQRIGHPQPLPWPRKRASKRDARVNEQVRARGRYSEVPSWGMMAGKLHEGDAVLVAAPLCVVADEATGSEAFLCDYPDFVRAAADPRVRLSVSAEAVQRLQDELGAAVAWHPFARVLGIAHQTPRGLSLDLLRLELRVPVPEDRRYTHQATWDEALVEEAAKPGYDMREAQWAEKQIAALRTFSPGPGMYALPDAIDPQARAELARRVALASDDTHRSLTRDSGTPYHGIDAFWCAAAALLPAWPREFVLESDKVEALLTAFDVAHGPPWQNIAGDPALAGAIRYRPAVMAEARARIAALSAPRATPRKGFAL